MEAIGPVLMLLSVPLMLRWIPPNRFYGFNRRLADGESVAEGTRLSAVVTAVLWRQE